MIINFEEMQFSNTKGNELPTDEELAELYDKYEHYEDMYQGGKSMTDKEAISNLNHIYGIVSSDIQRSLDLAIKALEERQGEWDKRHTELLKYFVKCEKCGEEIMTSHKNFCPNCGADMRGNKETTFDDYLKEQLKDHEFRKEWNKLRDEDMRKGDAEV